jgi:hypothetical protein
MRGIAIEIGGPKGASGKQELESSCFLKLS